MQIVIDISNEEFKLMKICLNTRVDMPRNDAAVVVKRLFGIEDKLNAAWKYATKPQDNGASRIPELEQSEVPNR